MDEYREPSAVSQVENKTQQISKKVWNIENSKLREVHSNGTGKIDHRLTKNISNGTSFIFVDNSESPPLRVIYGKQNNRFYNLITGLEV